MFNEMKIIGRRRKAKFNRLKRRIFVFANIDS